MVGCDRKSAIILKESENCSWFIRRCGPEILLELWLTWFWHAVTPINIEVPGLVPSIVHRQAYLHMEGGQN
jgi:hypothetical protein